MSNAFEIHSKSFDEIYEIVSAALVVQNRRTFKLEVLRSYWQTGDLVFSVRCFESKAVEENQVWVKSKTFPLIAAPSGDTALQQAFTFLREETKE